MELDQELHKSVSFSLPQDIFDIIHCERESVRLMNAAVVEPTLSHADESRFNRTVDFLRIKVHVQSSAHGLFSHG